MILFVRLYVAPANAQTSPTKLKIVLDNTLPKNLVYWFAAPSLPPSARQPLPQPGPDGMISLDVPAKYNQPGAEASVLDARKGLLAHLLIRDISGRLAGHSLGPNLLQNSEFTRDGEHWIAELTGGTAKGQIEWLGAADMPKGAAGRAARIKVLALDAVNWHVQLHQPGLDLEDNEPYTLTFWARADRARPVSINATVDKDDFHWIGLSNQVALTTEWRKVTLAFTATRTLPNHNRLGFVLGDSLGTVDLAGIMLQRGVVAGPLGANLLQNSNFTHGADSWMTSIVAPAKAKAKVPSEIAPPPAVPGKSAQVEVTATGMQNWYVQFFQTGINLTEGETLTLSFWAKSNRERPLSIIAGEDKEDFHTVGLDNYAGLGTTWKKYMYVFTATQTVRNSHRLTFLMGDNAGEVDLAGLALQPGAYAIVEPGRNIEATLSPADFKYAQAVSVPVKYKGKLVQDLAVTLKSGDENLGAYRLQPTDNGIAHFSNVPLDEKITVVVSDGIQTAEFPRIVASDAPDAVSEVEVPDTWTQVKTLANGGGRPLPLIGRWQSQSDTQAQRYITTFNADGTGTIRRAAEASVPSGPASGAFLWHVVTGDHRIVMSSREYTWSVSGKGKNETLTLKDTKGKTHIFYRR